MIIINDITVVFIEMIICMIIHMAIIIFNIFFVLIFLFARDWGIIPSVPFFYFCDVKWRVDFLSHEKKKQQNKSAAHEIRAGSGHVTFSSNRVIFICSLDAGVFATSGRVAIATRSSSTQIH